MKNQNSVKRALVPIVVMMVLGGCTPCGRGGAPSKTVNLSSAVIVVCPKQPRHLKAAEMLQHELQKRTGVCLEIAESMPESEVAAIVLGTVESLRVPDRLPKACTVPAKAEGYAMLVDTKKRHSPTVYLVGRDDRGALFAAGRLIRLANMSPGKITIAASLNLADAPAYPLRGHMLIPGGKFIEWDPAGYEQYTRDLVMFGTNSFELTDYHDFVAQILDSYGLDLWVFFGHGDVVDVKTIEDAIAKFGHLKGLDHVFIPLGDTSGVKATRVMIPAIEKFAPLLKQVHPQARIWISHQNQRNHAENENEYLFRYIQQVQPKWLEGMVYGPWAHWDIPGLRRRMPKQYKIRHYPDICHNRRCQYPIPKWDRAFARVWNRNGIRVMPRMAARVHNVTAPVTEGFVAYNHTGSNNDVEKFVWSAMAWDPNADLYEVLREYGKVFFGDDLADDVAAGLLMLEDNWTGPIAENGGIEKTLMHWQDIARRYGDVSKNWRLELFLYKAFIDVFVKRKHTAETQYEAEAYKALKTATQDGAKQAIEAARAALTKIDTQFPPKQDLKRELQSWGLSRYAELDETLDNLYCSLNDRQWLEAEFEEVLALQGKAEQAAAIDHIANWQDPGPGGSYDNLGVEGKQPHLVRQEQWPDDPGYVHSPIEHNAHMPKSSYRHSWLACALTRYDTPLLMRYEQLDRNAKYRIRVTYSGQYHPMMTLVADGKYEIHGPTGSPDPMRPLEFDIPPEATNDGVLNLRWELVNVVRGCQVAEVWLNMQHH